MQKRVPEFECATLMSSDATCVRTLPVRIFDGISSGGTENQKRAEYGFGEYGFKHRAQWALRGSLSSGERAQWAPFSLLFVCQSEFTEFFFRRTHRVWRRTQWGSVSSLLRNCYSGLETVSDLFSRVLFSFLPPLLATPLPPLFSAHFRPFLPLEKCSVL